MGFLPKGSERVGWVAKSMAERMRMELGSHLWDDWDRFLVACGMRWLFRDLPESVPALVVDRTVVLRKGMSEMETAKSAFHEGGHFLMAHGNRDFWLSRPQGYIMLAKLDRRAEEFAGYFPSSDE